VPLTLPICAAVEIIENEREEDEVVAKEDSSNVGAESQIKKGGTPETGMSEFKSIYL
jgi:hypothetical protein